jgi:hypothetical protein
MRLFKNLTPDEEAEFRQWARANYKPFAQINGVWHPVVQDECTKMNVEAELDLAGWKDGYSHDKTDY